MKTHVERLTAAYEEKRQHMRDAKTTNVDGLTLWGAKLRNALGITRDHALFALNGSWDTRDYAISGTKYSRNRDKYRAYRRNDFALARALDDGTGVKTPV